MTEAIPPTQAIPPTPTPGHAQQRSLDATRTYPCGSCGGELEFDIRQQKLACPHCGNVQELVESVGRTVTKRDLRATIAQLKTPERAEAQAQLVAGEKEVVCAACGGHTTFTGTLTSTRCPYCATPIQRDDVHQAPARLAVDGVLPFLVDDATAKAKLGEWVSSRWFAPNEFKTYNRTGSFTTVYASYFSYDAQADTSYTGERGEDYTVEVGSGDNKRTETRTRWYSASGQVHDTFEGLTVLANEGFERDHVTALEPWPLEQVKAFSHEYIAGHLSRTYDHDVEESFVEAEQRMGAIIDNTIHRDIGGDKQRVHSKNTVFSDLVYAHLLLPIWLLTVIYDGKPFQVTINGVTGEVHGQRPYSRVKIAIAAALAVAVIILVVVLVQAQGS